MAQVHKTVLVEHTPAQMFVLVDGVEHYAEFLPWCGGGEVKQRDERTTLATIHIDYLGIRQNFTTENTKEYPKRMDLRLVQGPFAHLQGHWHFIPLGEVACKIEFALEYSFASRAMEAVLTPVFSYIANTFVDAFVKRAEQVYVRG